MRTSEKYQTTHRGSHLNGRKVESVLLALCLGAITLFYCGCATPYQTAALGLVGATAVGAHSPSHEIQQIYYLGVFDPQEQIPPTIYRVTVHGQASFISGTEFASGWVPAQLVDSLNSRLSLDASGVENPLKFVKGEESTLSTLKTGRRLVMFGPEGFREAPRDHRLVIVMGASPQKFFEAIDTALGDLAQVRAERSNTGLQQKLFKALVQVREEQNAMKQFERDVDEELSKKSGSSTN